MYNYYLIESEIIGDIEQGTVVAALNNKKEAIKIANKSNAQIIEIIDRRRPLLQNVIYRRELSNQ